MAKLIVIDSGSQGNSYLLQVEKETLIIELGVSWKYILQSLNYDLSSISGALCSHIHNDHSKSIITAFRYGLNVYSCKDVQDVYKDVKVLQNRNKTKIGGFMVQRIDLFHDVECIGFLIEHNSFGRCLFATDTNSIPYRFKNINHYIVEANSDFEQMIDDACDNVYSRSASNNHLEISETIDFLKENFSKDCQSITLIHLSSQNADEEKFKKRVQEELGFSNVNVAKKGLVIELNKEEF